MGSIKMWNRINVAFHRLEQSAQFEPEPGAAGSN
jgi:hypothetical protein